MSMARGGNALSMRVNGCPLLFESKVAHFRCDSDRGPQCPDPVARGGGDDFSVRPFDYLATWDRSGELGFGTIAGAWPEPGRTSLLGLPPTRSLRRPPHDVLGGAGIEIVQLAGVVLFKSVVARTLIGRWEGGRRNQHRVATRQGNQRQAVGSSAVDG